MSRVNLELHSALALLVPTFMGLCIAFRFLDKANQHTTGRFHCFITRGFLIGYTRTGYYYLGLWLLSLTITGVWVFASFHFLGLGPLRD